MQNTSETLPLFTEETLKELTLSLSGRLAKISALLEKDKDLQETGVALSKKQLDSLLTSDQVFLSGKMLKEHSPLTLAKTLQQFCKRLPTLGVINLNGNCLIQAGFYPKIESEYTLSDILQKEVSAEYFLSEKMILLLEKKKKHQFQTQISGTLKANGNMNAEDTYIQVGTYRTHNDGKGFRGIKENVSPTIPARARTDGSGQPVIRYSYRDNNIRRLTEIECERLQGFPDDWTKWGCYDGETKEIAKTNRYKLIGNAVTVDIVELIARRIKIKK